MTLCPVGRTHNPNHPTCRTCTIGCTKPKRVQRVREVKTMHRGGVLVTTQPLRSMNHWHGRPRHVYLSYKREWGVVLSGMWAVWGVGTVKRYLTVHRYVALEGHLIKDRDNLIGALKPIKDILTEAGVIVDDADEWLEFDITQHIDPFARVEIEVTDETQPQAANPHHQPAHSRG